MKFELAELPYELNALEPYISKRTLDLHYWKHLQGYLKTLNTLIQGTKFKDLDLSTIIKVADGPVFNFAAQVWNHTFYFESLKPGNDTRIKESLEAVINLNFGSVSFFKSQFKEAVESFLGVGWVWVVMNPAGAIRIIQKYNAGNPMRIGLIPLLSCDVWEHAYYLDYQDNLADYADAYWHLINWEKLETRYKDALL